MEKYSRVFYFNNCLYLENSPIVVLAGAILKDNITNDIVGQLKLKNVSEKTIKSIEFELDLYDSAGEPQEEKVNSEFLDLDIQSDMVFGSDLAIDLPYNNTRSFKVKINKVVFVNGETWNNKKEFVRLEKQKLFSILDYNELDFFYKKIGNNNSKYVPIEKKDIWICSCGNVNLANEKVCTCCYLEKNVILNINFDKLKKESKKELYDISKYYLEETSNIDDIRTAKENFLYLENYKDSDKKVEECTQKIKKIEKEKKEKTKKIKKILIFSISIILIVGAYFLITMVMIPFKNYYDALTYMKQEKYEEAVEKLKTLPEYFGDAKKLINSWYYSYANKLFDEKQYEKAYMFYRESSLDINDERMIECTYLYASDLFEQKEYEEAYDKFNKYPDYKDSKNKEKESALYVGNDYMNLEEYSKAKEWYKKIPDEKKITQVNEKMYSYVKSHNNDKDEKTYDYLASLIEDKYKEEDAINMYNDLYKTRCIIVTNNEKDNTLDVQSSISRKERLYAHFKILDSNIPKEKIKLYEQIEGNNYGDHFKERFNKVYGYSEYNFSRDDWELAEYRLNKSLSDSDYMYISYMHIRLFDAVTGKELCYRVVSLYYD